MKNACLILLFLVLGAAQCRAQSGYIATGIGVMQPARKTFLGVEVGKHIAPRYSIALRCEVSPTESNVSPIISYRVNRLLFDAGMGWAHRWQKAHCTDHNFHTYTLGAYWVRQATPRISFRFGGAMVWRSYNSHIGLHRGALKLCAGITFDIKRKPKR